MTVEFERRFGGLRRLYGVPGAQAIFDAHVVVVGIGGVGSWAVEALARSGVSRLTLIDMDHVSESNINRQIHALEPTLGQSKAEAMRERIAQFHPHCQVDVIDDFVTADNWPKLLPSAAGLPSALIDACDQVRAKTALAAWALRERVPFVTVGAAGGKRLAQAVEAADLADVTHDPLLAQLRYNLRKAHGASRSGRMGTSCVFSREAVAPPDASCDIEIGDGSLNCHGYGSVVSVTATFGLCAAGCVMNALANSGKALVATSNQTKTTL
ncbi:tRNA threonylcarbamoyladenosine dehydratase [Hydrogenophaga sp. A37]|uniref:tRNA threonylcarbamoyladenosine dehydratase n=1 Tax=Hydrogenophaga sp. A37 TaxID=1945864 RepID=UPI0009876855|nr:tRNA threonylcarbamoyladenosine dehydratase [Hydrogenophaga sp. A37]OOG81338.1 tRNA threonylcarbamoyladenosine dehydratase [Hydrogenophaga sp. A37]